MTKRIKSTTEKIETRERAEEIASYISGLVISRDALTAEMEKRIQDVRSQYHLRFVKISLALERLLPAIQAWAEANPQLFAEKKSLEMVHALVGFRTGMPQVKTIKGLTWEKVKAMLVNHNLGYTRTEVVVDKEALIADRQALGPEGLAKRGVRVVQEEAFFIEPKREEVPA